MAVSARLNPFFCGSHIVLTDRSQFVALHGRWFLFFWIALFSAGGWYFAAASGAERWPGGSSVHGWVLGVVAGLILLFECALGLRKTRWFRTVRILGTAQTWMKAHIWLGLLVAPLAWMHAGFVFGGPLTTILMAVLGIVIVSGLFGLWMQNVVPNWMLEHVPNETVYSQIDVVRGQYAEEAARIASLSCGRSVDLSVVDRHSSRQPDRAELRPEMPRVVGAQRRIGAVTTKTPEGSLGWRPVAQPTALWQAYDDFVRPYLQQSRSVAGPLHSRRRSRDFFESLRASTGEDARTTIAAWEHLCDKSRDLHLQRRLHWLLHGWLAVHLPLSISLLILLAIHVFFALRIG